VAQEVLMIPTKTIEQLKMKITAKQSLNCFSREFTPGNKKKLEPLLTKLKETYNHSIYVDIDIQGFESCEEEDQEANVLLEIINRELDGKGLDPIHPPAISIASALLNWSKTLDKHSLLVFHCFHDPYKAKEKNILRSLRKALRNELSSYIRLLILSNREITRWHLFPESNLDERYTAFFELKNAG
jgi:hypothetical protein